MVLQFTAVLCCPIVLLVVVISVSSQFLLHRFLLLPVCVSGSLVLECLLVLVVVYCRANVTLYKPQSLRAQGALHLSQYCSSQK